MSFNARYILEEVTGTSIATGQLLYPKILLAGNNITLTSSGNSITINSTGGGTGSTGNVSSSILYYTGGTPSNTTVGGLSSGTVLTGKTYSQLFQDMLITYQSPAFNAFSITGQDSTIEVGSPLSGSKLYTWTTSNSSNISGSSISIRDVNTNSYIVQNTTNDGSQSINIGTITNTSPISQSWRAEARNTNAVNFNSSSFTVSSIYPYFYGKVASSGAAAGANRPTINAALVTGGTKVVSSSTGTLSITYNSTNDDYVWFAIPSTSTSKTVWYVSALNNGTIGGIVSPGGNLFPASTTQSVTTVLWSGVSYKVYLANYQSEITSIELRNS